MDRSEAGPTGDGRDGEGQSFVERRSGARLRIPSLTVLWHTDLSRVGDRTRLHSLLEGTPAPVSRNGPPFRHPRGGRSRPLRTSALPREAVRLSAGSGYGTVRLSRNAFPGRLAAAGTEIEDEIEIPGDRVEQGVVLELGDTVILLLHHLPDRDLEPAPDFGFVGESEGLAELRRDVRRVADLEVPVLLRGETGTGKELLARAIHRGSRRRRAPYESVNMGAIPPTLAASELFGAAKGAFTGAVRSQKGYFARADGGTLFMDEVGEAPPEVQVMLLRVLETGEIQPVGVQETQRVDVRLIAATDADLERSSTRGGFRLLHRLAGYEILVPPLRARRDDFGRLLVHFLGEELERTGEESRLEGDPSSWLPTSIVARLARYEWPGNVRQLRNIARQLVIGSRGAEMVRIGPQLERVLQEAVEPSGREQDAAEESPGTTARSRRRPRRVYRDPSGVGEEELVDALRRNRWAIKPTAEDLGVSRTSLYTLIERSPAVRKAADLERREIERSLEQCAGDLGEAARSLEVSAFGLRQRMRELEMELE